jgi:integrase
MANEPAEQNETGVRSARTVREPVGAALLAVAAGRVVGRPAVSPARARQVRWVAGEYARALEHPDHPLNEEATAGELFARAAVDAYLRLAAAGELRVRRAAAPARASGNSEQTRLEVLRLLATACDIPHPAAGLPPQPDTPRHTPVPGRPRALLRTQLTHLADTPGATPGRIRMLAIGAVVCDTGIRAGEMCALTVDDLSPHLEEIRVVRRPQGRTRAEAYTELLPLSSLSRDALRAWLPERHRLLTRIGGTATALWVSLHANHHHGRPVPEGTPLMPRGLARAWTRAVTETNLDMAGHPSWEPLPTRMEQLRRGVTPTPAPAPMRPDAAKATRLLTDMAVHARALTALQRGTEENTTAEHRARTTLRQAVRDAWAEGIPQTTQLTTLTETGPTDTASLATAGWEPTLLTAIQRAHSRSPLPGTG